MSNLAFRLDERAEAIEVGTDPWSRLPAEAPLDMPRQDIGRDAVVAPTAKPASSPATVSRRRWTVFGGTFALTGVAAIAPFILFAREGFDGLEMAAFGVFLVLITAIACWFVSSLAGFIVLLNGREQRDLDFAPNPPAPTTRTALLMPLYNEDAGAALGRLASLDASLARLGVSDAFDLFVLSDSRIEDAIVAEQLAFGGFRQRAHSQAFYRRRPMNTEHKAGNIGDWTRRFGGAYEFMVVLDADSTMAGETVLRLVDAMERNPGVGLIQTAPTIVKAETLFSRVSQFGVRLYGRVAAAGLAFWAGSEASYWGHNAILRVRAFAECAGLPVLPGKKPFGGNVMSHDVVEAALMRRAGWAVHVTAALDGSCEETPPSLTDFVRRDHRWCQGNLQHLGLIAAPGLNFMSRLQLAMGCMAYLSSPLWFLSLVLGLAIQLRYPTDWGSFLYFLHPELSGFMLASLLAGVLLIGPKLMGGALVMSRPGERRAFGGGRTLIKGMASEVALSALLAPILMVSTTRAIVLILSGKDAGWTAQTRTAEGLGWKDAFRAMRWQMITGLGFCAGLAFRPDLSLMFAPIVLPLLFAPALAVWTSRVSIGERAARAGCLVTPEETASATPAIVRYDALRRVSDGLRQPAYGG